MVSITGLPFHLCPPEKNPDFPIKNQGFPGGVLVISLPIYGREVLENEKRYNSNRKQLLISISYLSLWHSFPYPGLLLRVTMG